MAPNPYGTNDAPWANMVSHRWCVGSPYLLESEIPVKAGPCSPESTARLESCVSGNPDQQQRSACNHRLSSRRTGARMSTGNGARIASRSVHNMVLATEAFVKSQVAALSHDASHDWSHIDRVRKMALVLAKEEGDSDLEVVELASLLHDVQDWKYSGSVTAGAATIQEFLCQCSYSLDKQKAVLDVIKGIGFKDEVGSESSPKAITAELAAVQDADRLDAIGAIGIARCFSFGGRFERPLYDPAVPPRDKLTKSKYMDSTYKPTTINHFYEKLLKLQGMMKTEAGRRRAKQRHEFMQAFLQEFMLEWDAHA